MLRKRGVPSRPCIFVALGGIYPFRSPSTHPRICRWWIAFRGLCAVIFAESDKRASSFFPTPASMRQRRHRLEYLHAHRVRRCENQPRRVGGQKKVFSYPPREILLLRRNSRKSLQFVTIKCGTFMSIPLLLLNGRVGK